MWNKPWKIKEGVFICIGLLVTGLMLQLSVGSVVWRAFSYPLNIYLLVGLLFFICLIYLSGNKIYAFKFIRSSNAAVPALCFAVLMTILMGLIKQVPDGMPSVDVLGFTNMLSSWPFILAYLYVVVILGLVVIDRLINFRRGSISFILNHAGLFVIIVAATLGSADIQKLTMNVARDVPEWRAVDVHGKIKELPVAVQLLDFDIDEYPPKLILIDNNTGREIPERKPCMLIVDNDFKSGFLGEWEISLLRRIDDSAPAMERDTTYYVPWSSTGAVCALYIEAHRKNKEKEAVKKGWVTCGSYLFPYQAMVLNDSVSLVMADREPQRYLSKVQVLTKHGDNVVATIEVNKPLSIDGWKIYQLSYDTSRGKWSEISVLQLVKDPWLPVVYVGIFMLAAGAVCMIFYAGRKREECL